MEITNHSDSEIEVTLITDTKASTHFVACFETVELPPAEKMIIDDSE